MRLLKAKHKRRIRKGTKIITKFFEATGLPHGYSVTLAWFAERMVLACIVLMTLSFASGVLFTARLAEPIGNSDLYNAAVHRANLAEQGIRVFSQQVIDVASPVFLALVTSSRSDEELQKEVLAMRKEKIKIYLESKSSPFSKDDEAIEALAVSRNMKLMLAISFVESTFGQHCYYYNCSGIGGTPPNLRKYSSYAEWIKDFDQLLENRYKDLPPEEFIGLYVQPGSPNWLYGVKQVLRELDEQEIS